MTTMQTTGFDKDAFLALDHHVLRRVFADMTGTPATNPNKLWMVRKMEALVAQDHSGQLAAKAADLLEHADETPPVVAATEASAAIETNGWPIVMNGIAGAAEPVEGPPANADLSAAPEDAAHEVRGEPTGGDGGGGDSGSGDDGGDDDDEEVLEAGEDDDESELATSGANKDTAEPLPRGGPAPPTGESASSRRVHRRFANCTIAELQHVYLKIVGRPTGSTNRAYLGWKILEAEKGRVRVGPLQPRDGKGTAKASSPALGLSAELNTEFDAICTKLGFRNATAFIRRAVGEELRKRGETTFALQFLPPVV